MWDLYLEYNRSAEGDIYCIYMQCGMQFSSGTYASNVKYMYTSAPGYIVDCSEFVRHIY